MSYIITSNQDLDDRPETSNIFKPYSYTNRLTDTMKIEKDSEVAVESVKINKNGLYSLNAFNSKLALYFGQNVAINPIANNHVGKTDIGFIEEGTNVPVAHSIVETSTFQEYTPKQVADELTRSLGKMLMNPLFVVNISSPTSNPNLHPDSKVEPKYDASGNFVGYEIDIHQKPDHSSVLPNFPAETPNTEGLISELIDTQFTWDNADQEFECTDPTSTRGACALLGDRPVSFSMDPTKDDMSFEVDFQQASSGTSRWCIGLCRKNDKQFNPSGSFKCTSPPYYDINAGKGQGNIGWSYSKQFYDFVVCRVGDDLRVFQSCVDSDRNPRAMGKDSQNLIMREVDYYHANNPTFKGGVPYNIDTNAGGYTAVSFKISNEVVSAFMVKGAAYTPLVDLPSIPASTKQQLFTPVSDLQRTLYGKVYLKKNGDILEVMERHVYDHISSWDCTNPYAQLSTHLIATDQYDRWGKLLENRIWNNMNATDTTVYSYMSTNANFCMEGYNMVLLTAEAHTYLPEYTRELSAARLLGFDGRFIENKPELTPAKPDQESFKFESIKRPDLISPKSLFIRLNNFTHNTAVGTKGNAYSKILAHLPRFDNSGAETGGLYFEPYERLYVALNNAEELNVNAFDLDIVYDNEQLAECLVGKTIICLHIRPRGVKLLDSEVRKGIKKKVEEVVIRD